MLELNQDNFSSELTSFFNFVEEELISDLRRVANELKTDYVSRSVYEKYGWKLWKKEKRKLV